MKTKKRELGDLGERAAVNYLKRLGYKVIQTNYLIPGMGEIDIVAIDSDKTLVFVEVKTMRNVSRETFDTPLSINTEPTAGYRSVWRSGDTLLPEDQLTKAKLKKMKNAAQMFHVKHLHLIKKAGFRIDAITISIFDSLTSFEGLNRANLFKFEGKVLEINHYKNVT